MASVEVDLGLLKPLRFVGQMDSTNEVAAHHLRERWGPLQVFTDWSRGPS